MKKTLKIFSLVLSAVLCFCFASCSGGGGSDVGGSGGGNGGADCAEGHSYVEVSVVEPTCVKGGYTLFECSRCGTRYSGAVVEKLGHDFVSHEGKTPTCSNAGYSEWHTCTRCDYNDYSLCKQEKLWHNYNESGVCTVCGFARLHSFGSYPKTKVTDESTLASLNALISEAGLPSESGESVNENGESGENSAGWVSYNYYLSAKKADYMWYKDVSLGSERYRAVYFTSYRSKDVKGSGTAESSYQDDYGYFVGNVYWFKFEPLNWIALNDEGDDGKVLLWCVDIIDCHEYQSDCVYVNPFFVLSNASKTIASSYEKSNVRAWLNSDFYSSAFSDDEKTSVLLTNVDNGGNSTGNDGNRAASANTSDYVFMLCYRDMINEKYGFTLSDNPNSLFWGVTDELKQKVVTDYAKSQGAWTGSIGDDDREGNLLEQYAQNGIWLLRSPRQVDIMNLSSAGDQVLCYNADGTGRAGTIYYTSNGIAPAIYVDRSVLLGE